MTPVQYKFTKLSDIRIGEIYNIIAVVKYFQKPEKTRGTGYKMTVSITDPSLGYDNKLTCNIFNDRPENLPRISSRGDVIIIHRLKIGSYREQPQGTGTHKLGFAAAVVSHEDSARLLDLVILERLVDLIKSDSSHFNITKDDFEIVKTMMIWADDMPQSQKDEVEDEVDFNNLHFSTLSVISVGEIVSLAVQVVSIISVDYSPYQTILLVWDATKPNYNLNKKFITSLSRASSVKHCIPLVAKLGGKLSNPWLTSILFKESVMELQQSFVRPGDYVFLTRISVLPSDSGPGVVLVGDQCRLGMLPQDCPLFEELQYRINGFIRYTPCVADCIGTDIGTLNSFHLQDYGKMLQEISSLSADIVVKNNSYKFKITAKVVNVHPSSEKEFYESLILYCTCCQRFNHQDSLFGASEDSGPICQRSLVAIPMVTVIFEDFTGWLTVLVVGKAAMGLTSLVMIDATKPEWWLQLLSNPGSSSSKSSIDCWLTHLGRLKHGWIDGKIVFRRAAHGNIVPFLEDVVILDY